MRTPHTVGIDLGGTTVRTGVYDAEWQLLECITQPTRVAEGPQAVVQDMAQGVLSLTRKYGFTPAAIGLGSPGPLDLVEGRLLQLPNFPGWDFFPIRENLSTAIGIPVVLESDANAAALAEWKAGAGKACAVDSMCMLTMGTGIGGGLVLSGKLWHGRNGMAGELGHIIVDAFGERCGCGARGCLESCASATAIASAGRKWFQEHTRQKSFKDGDVNSLTTLGMAEMAAGGHAGMCSIFEQVGRHLGLALASIANTLDLPLYVIGGGVADAWELFAPSLFETISDYSYVYQLSRPLQKEHLEPGRAFITRALLGPQAGLLGAAMVSLASK